MTASSSSTEMTPGATSWRSLLIGEFHQSQRTREVPAAARVVMAPTLAG